MICSTNEKTHSRARGGRVKDAKFFVSILEQQSRVGIRRKLRLDWFEHLRMRDDVYIGRKILKMEEKKKVYRCGEGEHP